MTLKELFECFYYGSSCFHSIELWEEEPRNLIARFDGFVEFKQWLIENSEMCYAKVKWSNVFCKDLKLTWYIVFNSKEGQ